jgi:hypothetical protein
MKYFGPYSIVQCFGLAAYKLDLPPDAKVHPVFHVSQLKPFTPNYVPMFNTLPKLLDLEKDHVEPEAIVHRRLVKKGNHAIVQLCIKWTNLLDDVHTWEDEHVLRP